MKQNEIIQTVKTMIAAPSCCQELKDAGQKWLDAVGTPEKLPPGTLCSRKPERISAPSNTPWLFSNRKWERRFSARKRPKRWPPMPATVLPKAPNGATALPVPLVKNSLDSNQLQKEV